jgi:hypothetical protein
VKGVATKPCSLQRKHGKSSLRPAEIARGVRNAKEGAAATVRVGEMSPNSRIGEARPAAGMVTETREPKRVRPAAATVTETREPKRVRPAAATVTETRKVKRAAVTAIAMRRVRKKRTAAELKTSATTTKTKKLKAAGLQAVGEH